MLLEMNLQKFLSSTIPDMYTYHDSRPLLQMFGIQLNGAPVTTPPDQTLSRSSLEDVYH